MNTQPSANRLRKMFYSLLILISVSLSVFSQNVGINATGAQPNAAAGLDVDFMNMGLLIPRVALTGTTIAAPLTAKVAGMIVYNTATVADVTPGFYYNDGANWIAGFPGGSSIGDMLYWNGTAWVKIPVGTSGQYLQLSASNVPTWTGATFSTLTTTIASAITGITASSGGNITTDGGTAVLARGVCWKTTTGPTIANFKTIDGTGIGTFTSNLTGLSPVTTYYVKAYSTNSNATTYGNEISFTTLPVLPTLAATVAATSITGTTAVTGGNITSDGGATVTERGVCYGAAANPTTTNLKVVDAATGAGTFVSNLTGLVGYTTYYVRAYAINSTGTNYGTQISFTTLRLVPTLFTTAITSIAGASATSGGSMNWNGGGYSNYMNVGIAYSTVSNSATPTKVVNSSNFSVNPLVNITPWVTNITGLAANTTYYVRSCLDIYPTGTGPWVTVYGPEVSFTTTAPSAPVITSTTAITGISDRAANSGGAITSDGGSAITAKGVCWSTSPSPTLGVGNFTSNGTGTAGFTSNITGLTGNTAYYVRAYATNGVGTSYGPSDVSFTTWVTAPYTIGQDLGYGWCAYVDATGHGFIVSYDIPFTGAWGCSGTILGTATGTAIGTGLANTNLILANCATRPIAASVAKAYTGGGFSDWYLPSSGEWQQILLNRNVVGLSYPNTSNYYTSTEQSSSTTTYAVSCFFNASSGYMSGAAKTGGSAQYIANLRAIRSF